MEKEIIKKALIEADKGKFISDKRMMAWINSWDIENELPSPKPSPKVDVYLK